MAARGTTTTDISDAVARVVAVGRVLHPGIRDSPALDEALTRWCANIEASLVLEDARLGETFLACACVAGDAVAWSILERDVLPAVRRAIASIVSADAVDDVLQALRTRMFVPPEQAPVLRYVGRGELVGLLRVTGIRLALNHVRDRGDAAAHHDGTLSNSANDGVIATDDPELALLRSRSGAMFRATLEEAVADLSVRERNVLRMHHVEQLSIDGIARLYRVHRATAARWLEHAREAVADGVRARLEARTGGTEGIEALKLIRSQLQLSLTRILSRDPPG